MPAISSMRPITTHVNLVTPMHPNIDSPSTSADMLDAMLAMKLGMKKPKLEVVLS